ncbi:MAG: hypothetical protein EAX90_15800 [Candidatus Heimdallarchaeota archaeon]|nr:hypothetical protein [Candidatus Heimdallarchaeota archaeon]
MSNFKEKLFHRENNLKTSFIIIFSIASVALLINSIVLYIIYKTIIFEKLLYYSFFLIIDSILGILLVLTRVSGGNYQPDIEKEDLVNSEMSVKQVKADFKNYLAKYVIKNDELYLKYKKRRSIIDYIILFSFILILTTDVLIIIFEQEIISLLLNLGLLVSENTGWDNILLFKLLFDLIIMCFLYVIRSGKITKKIWNKRDELLSEYHNFIKEEIGIEFIDIGTLLKPGKGVEFKEKITLNPTHYRNMELSLQEEINIFHELANFIIYRYQNYKDVIFYGIIIGLPLLLSVIFLDSNNVYFSPFIISFFVIIGFIIAFTSNRVSYIRLAKGVIGSKTSTYEENQNYWSGSASIDDE